MHDEKPENSFHLRENVSIEKLSNVSVFTFYVHLRTQPIPSPIQPWTPEEKLLTSRIVEIKSNE